MWTIYYIVQQEDRLVNEIVDEFNDKWAALACQQEHPGSILEWIDW